MVEYEPDTELRETEQIPMQEEGGIEAFLEREVLPYAADAWYQCDSMKVDYEISFNRYFYKPAPMRRGPYGLLTSTPPVTRARKLKTGSVELTIRQADVRRELRHFVKRHAVAPTRVELGTALGLHQNAVDNHLHRMSKKGWVELHPGVEPGRICTAWLSESSQ